MFNDEQVIMLYRAWSEEIYAASFMTPDASCVQQFRQWLELGWHSGEREDYETKMLEEYRIQEAATR